MSDLDRLDEECEIFAGTEAGKVFSAARAEIERLRAERDKARLDDFSHPAYRGGLTRAAGAMCRSCLLGNLPTRSKAGEWWHKRGLDNVACRAGPIRNLLHHLDEDERALRGEEKG